jgi:hypothetical protein
MAAPAPLLLEHMVRHHASFEEIEDFIEQLPISEDHRSALWLWARFGLPPEHGVSGHAEERHLSAHDGPGSRPSRRERPALRPARRGELQLTVE